MEDGAAALNAVRSAPPGTYDLVLMDIQMPVMNGWQAAEAIRALPDPALSQIPIVALSANVFESDIRRSYDAGMEAHLAKPIDVPSGGKYQTLWDAQAQYYQKKEAAE